MKQNDSARDAIEAMGLTIGEVEDADQALRDAGPVRDGQDQRICICGHAVRRHTEAVGVVRCKPSKMECPCRKVRPVLEAQDTRLFLRKTSGAGALHALTLGILSHVESGKSIQWLIDLKCDRCESADAPIVPVPVTQSGRAVTHSIGYDAMLCSKCRIEV